MHWNVMNVDDFASRKLLLLKYNSDDQIIQNFYKIGPPRNSSSLFYLQKFQDSEKSTPELCKVHWNLMDDDELESTKLLK